MCNPSLIERWRKYRKNIREIIAIDGRFLKLLLLPKNRNFEERNMMTTVILQFYNMQNYNCYFATNFFGFGFQIAECKKKKKIAMNKKIH